MKKLTLILLPAALLQGGLLDAQSINFSALGKGVSFTAPDTSASVRISARIQNLFVAEQALDSKGSTELEGMVRRARLKFDGFALNNRIVYKVEIGLSNRDISFSDDSPIVGKSPKLMYDAVLKYKLSKTSTLWFGQTKLPGNRERVISSQKLQFVDRSIVNKEFNIDRDFGLQLHNEFNAGKIVIRPIVSISLGEGRDVTTVVPGGLDYTGRLEFLPFGKFESEGDYFSSDLKREKTPKLSVGITGDYNDRTVRQSGQLGKLMLDSNGKYMETSLTTGIADLMFKYKGFSVLSEAAYRTANDINTVDDNGNKLKLGFGYNVQAGYLLKSNFEIAGRYSRVAPLAASKSSVNHYEEYTLGLSKYFVGHNLKLQTDLTYQRGLSNTFAGENLIFRLQTELAF